MPGGTSYYFTYAINQFSPLSYQLVTALGESEMEEVEKIRSKNIDVIALPSKHSVYFENKYGDNMDNRTQRVLAKADPFTAEGLEGVQAKFYHLGSLLADDFSLDVIKYLSKRGTLAVDVQGYLREVRGEEVYAIDWKEKEEAARYIHILKANEHEMEVLTGERNPRKAARILAEWGIKEVLLTLGSMGSLIYADGQFYTIPAYEATEVVDATGCGDTYMAGYLYMRNKGASFEEAGCFAAAMCTLKIQQSGPFCGTEADIQDIIGIERHRCVAQ